METNLGRVAVLLASVGGHFRLGALSVGALLVHRLLLVVRLGFSYSERERASYSKHVLGKISYQSF